MIFKLIKYTPESKPTHEKVPKEDLWEDGELRLRDVEQKILLHVLDEGDWILVREVYNGED
jgi:hypothetical protein